MTLWASIWCPSSQARATSAKSLYHFHILMPELHWWSPSQIKIYNLISYSICKILDICECLTHFETWWRSGWGLTESNCPILLVPFDLQEHKIHNMLCLLWIIYLCFDQIPRILNTKHITNITHKCGGNNMRKGNYQCFSIGDFSPWKGCHGGGIYWW